MWRAGQFGAPQHTSSSLAVLPLHGRLSPTSPSYLARQVSYRILRLQLILYTQILPSASLLKGMSSFFCVPPLPHASVHLVCPLLRIRYYNVVFVVRYFSSYIYIFFQTVTSSSLQISISSFNLVSCFCIFHLQTFELIYFS